MNASRCTATLRRRTLAASTLATLSVLFAAPALAQPYPEPAITSPGVTIVSLSGSERDVLDARADGVPQEAGQCPTNIGSLVADLELAGLDAHAASYAVYAITDDCDESVD